MKKLLTTLALGMVSVGAFAQTTNGITYTDEHIVIDVKEVCHKAKKFLTCDLNNIGLGVVLTGSGSNDYYSYNSSASGVYIKTKITSNIPIVKVDYACGYSSYCGTLNGSLISGESTATSATIPLPGLFELNFNAQYGTYPTKIYLSTGIPTFLKESYTSAANILKSTYSGVLRNVNGFKNEIAKSHRGHLDRFDDALNNGIALLDAKDKNGKGIYSVLDWRVQENARLIVVFGTVINELLTDYDDVERLKNSIRSMRVLVDQLRQAYGWDRGLAGTVSKASSSLIEVVRLELQELASIKMAMGASDFQIYLDLLKVTRTLQAKTDASRSGDMKAQREIFDMLDLWNSKSWQDEMNRLMNAGPDFKNLVIPKLSMLIYAIESISDLSDQEFIIPDRKTLQ